MQAFMQSLSQLHGSILGRRYNTNVRKCMAYIGAMSFEILVPFFYQLNIMGKHCNQYKPHSLQSQVQKGLKE